MLPPVQKFKWVDDLTSPVTCVARQLLILGRKQNPPRTQWTRGRVHIKEDQWWLVLRVKEGKGEMV